MKKPLGISCTPVYRIVKYTAIPTAIGTERKAGSEIGMNIKRYGAPPMIKQLNAVT
jgi:hypothetical protein